MRDVVTAAEWFALACLVGLAIWYFVVSFYLEPRRQRREWGWRIDDLEEALAEERKARQEAEAELERLRGSTP